MSYLIDLNEELSEQLQGRLRWLRKKMNGSDRTTRMRIKRLENQLRERVVSHEKMETFMDRMLSDKIDPLDWFYNTDPELTQVRELKNNLERSSNFKYSRARVNEKKLKGILEELLQLRINEYLSTDMGKKKILCIVGSSGSGKTLASLHLKYHKDANVICSFTTRLPRKTEVEGRDHHFIDIVPDRTQLLTYTHFGNHYYYALKEQVYGPCTVYVIDEKGLRNLRTDHGDEYRIFSVLLKRDWKNKKKCGVEYKRVVRDFDREEIPEDEYDYVIDNNGSKKELFNNIERIYETIKNME